MTETYSTLLWFNRAKAKKNGEAPIYCHITINGERAELATKEYVQPAKWDVHRGQVKGSSEEARRINHQIENITA